MDIIIKISTLYGISFLIAMFVAAIIWALYQVIGNQKLFQSAKNLMSGKSGSEKLTQETKEKS